MTQDDYRALREDAALGAIAPRGQVALTGADRAAYLQGLLTNDIPALQPGTGCYAAWLSPQGRMLTDMHVLESGSMILLDLPAGTAVATLERLEQFIFSEDVQVASMAGTLSAVWIHGPRAAAVLTSVLDFAPPLESWRDYQHAQLTLGDVTAADASVAADLQVHRGDAVSVARIDQLGVPGYVVYVDAPKEQALVAVLRAAGARVVSDEALRAARIEAGYPVYGIDMTGDTIPLEAGIEERAISFTKGCYVGQEIIIRVLHRGGGRVAKKLVGLRIDADAAEAGTKLFAGAKEIGAITSAATSPELGAIALGYVHRDFAAPGTQIEVDAGGTRRKAVVTARPMV